jgi:hypothetical protein
LGILPTAPFPADLKTFATSWLPMSSIVFGHLQVEMGGKNRYRQHWRSEFGQASRNVQTGVERFIAGSCDLIKVFSLLLSLQSTSLCQNGSMRGDGIPSDGNLTFHFFCFSACSL